jgi:hypothetical protein
MSGRCIYTPAVRHESPIQLTSVASSIFQGVGAAQPRTPGRVTDVILRLELPRLLTTRAGAVKVCSTRDRHSRSTPFLVRLEPIGASK